MPYPSTSNDFLDSRCPHGVSISSTLSRCDQCNPPNKSSIIEHKALGFYGIPIIESPYINENTIFVIKNGSIDKILNYEKMLTSLVKQNKRLKATIVRLKRKKHGRGY